MKIEKFIAFCFVVFFLDAHLCAQQKEPLIKLSAEGDTLLLMPYDKNGVLNGSFIRPDSIEEYNVLIEKEFFPRDDIFSWISLTQKGTFKNNSLEGLVQAHRKGDLVCYQKNYSNGKLHGVHKRYDTNGALLLEENYKNDLLHGTVKKFLLDGKLTHLETYENGILHGESCFYRKGLMVKTRTVFNQGELEFREVFGFLELKEKDTTIVYLAECYTGKNWLNHGVWLSYYNSGQIRKQCEYNQGEATGEWKGWYENGQLKYLLVYSEETVVFYEEYDEEGNVK